MGKSCHVHEVKNGFILQDLVTDTVFHVRIRSGIMAIAHMFALSTKMVHAVRVYIIYGNGLHHVCNT